MRTIRLLNRLSFFSITVLVSGCTLTVGPLDDNGGSEPSNPPVIPAPEDPPGEEPVLDDAKQAREEEVERYVAEVIYKRATITGSIQLSSGDIIDGLDRATLPTLPYGIPPLPGALEQMAETALPPGVELGLSDLDQVPELRDLVDTAAPIQRPTFWPYVLGETDATSIQDYLDRYQFGGAPSGDARLYAGLVSKEPNRGVSGFMNQFRPEVVPDSFSLLEFTVACPADGPAQEQIGIVISVDKANGFGKNGNVLTDGQPRLHIEYARPKGGQVKYTWDETDGQFVANPFRRYHPGQIVPVSEVGGAQVEHLMAIFQVPSGDWWIAYRHELLGYYPASLFTMLNGPACSSAWYGEVMRRYPSQGEIKTEMASGRFAEAGFLSAAYVRNPIYYDTLWFGAEPKDDISMRMRPYEPSCYNRTPLVAGVLFIGGSGGKNPECRWPLP